MNASIWENALFSFLWSGETVRKVTLVKNSADYEDSNDDDDDDGDDVCRKIKVVRMKLI